MASDRELEYYWRLIDLSTSQFTQGNRNDRDRTGRWRFFLDQFAGRQRKVQEGITINVTWALIENFVAQLLQKHPKVSCLPRRPEDYKSARARQLWLNYQIEQVNLFGEALQALYDACIFGMGIIKIGLTGQAKAPFPLQKPHDPQAPTSVAEQSGSERPTEGEPESLYRRFSPWAHRVDPSCVLTAPGTSIFDFSPYIIHKLYIPYQELIRRKGEYEHLDKVSPSARYGPDGSIMETSTSQDDDRDYCELYEIWDKTRQRVITLCPTLHDYALRDLPWPYIGLKGYPFKALVLHPIPRQLYGYSMVDLIADHQEELNTLRGYMMAHFKRAGKICFVDDNILSKEKCQQAARAGPWSFFPVKTQGDRQWLWEFPTGTAFDPNIYSINQVLLEGIRLVTGLSDFEFGASTKGKSATEASLMGEARSQRMGLKSAIFDRWMGEVVQAIDAIGRQAVTEEQWLWISGPDGLKGLPFRPEDARAEVDVRLEVGSTTDPQDDPVKKKQTLELMTLALNPTVIQMAGTNVPALMAEGARAIGIPDPERFWPVLQEPMSPEDENRLMAVGVRVKRHPMDNDMQHLQAHQMAMLTSDPLTAPVWQEHILEHQGALQAVQEAQMMGEDGMGGGGGPPGMGSPLTPRAGNPGIEGAAPLEGPEGENRGESLRQEEQLTNA